MDNIRPRLHVVIYYQGDSKAQLQKKLIAYTKKLSDGPYEPSIYIYMNNFKKTKAAHRALTCDIISVFNVKQTFKDIGQLYVFIIILGVCQESCVTSNL